MRFARCDELGLVLTALEKTRSNFGTICLVGFILGRSVQRRRDAAHVAGALSALAWKSRHCPETKVSAELFFCIGARHPFSNGTV